MKGCFKPAITLLGILLILGAVASLLLMSQADTYLKRWVEASITGTSGAPAHIESFRILPLRQSIEIGGLVIDNPPGWRAEPAVKVDSLLLHFDASTLFSEQPRIKEIEVKGARVSLRYEMGQGVNLTRLTETAGESAPEKEAAGRFCVDVFRCRDVKVVLSGLLPGNLLNVDLAPFTLTELNERPVTAGEATAIFVRSVVIETVTVKGLLKPVAEKVREHLKLPGNN